MAEYQVTLPIAGTAYMTVEADSREEAINKALEDVTKDDIESWEALRRLVQGSVCYAETWEAEAEEAEAEEA